MHLDWAILVLVNRRWTSPVLDWWAAIVTSAEVWGPLALVLVLVALWKGGRKFCSVLLIAAVSLALGDGLIVHGVKLFVHRPRPFQVREGVRTIHLAHVKPRLLAFGEPLEVAISGPSAVPAEPRAFPSGHAWNSFTMATIIACAYRRRGWLAFIPATLVAYARVYSGAHWPSDVLAPIVLAPPVTLLVVHGFERVRRALAPSAPALTAWFPSLAAGPAA